MKRLLITFCISILTLTSNSQNLPSLDKKYGINIFKLESDFKNYSNLEFMFKGDDGVKNYKYVGKKSLKLFGIEAKSINLCFFNNKLYCVIYNFYPLSTFDEKSIKTSLTELFGFAGEGNNKTPLDYKWADVWETKKTYLHFAKYNSNPEGFSNTYEIMMLSNVVRNKILNSNF